jgi:hypothetical protein
MSGDQTTLDLQGAMTAGLAITGDYPGQVPVGSPGDDAGQQSADRVPVADRGADVGVSEEPVAGPEGADAGIPDPDFGDGVEGHEGRSFRFKSHDEAERGYRELQRKMTEIAEERKEFQKKLAEIEAKEAESRSIQDLGEKIGGIYDRMYEEVGKMDVEDPEYSKKVARLQAEAQTQIVLAQRETARPAAQVAPSADVPQLPATDVAEDYRLLFNREVAPRLAAAKVEATDPVYLYYADRVGSVDEQGNAVPLGKQVERAVSLTKTYYNKKAAQQRSRDNAPLQRHGGFSPTHPAQRAQNQAPATFGDIMDAALESRRIV